MKRVRGIAAALAAAFADRRVSGLINELGGVFGMVLGVVGAAALMLFISIISVTKACLLYTSDAADEL